MKPKPLDLDKRRCICCKFVEWCPADNTFTCKLTGRVVRPDFTCIVLDELGIKQLIKSACEWLLNEIKKLKNEASEGFGISGEYDMGYYTALCNVEDLIKQAFADIFEQETDSNKRS